MKERRANSEPTRAESGKDTGSFSDQENKNRDVIFGEFQSGVAPNLNPIGTLGSGTAPSLGLESRCCFGLNGSGTTAFRFPTGGGYLYDLLC